MKTEKVFITIAVAAVIAVAANITGIEARENFRREYFGTVRDSVSFRPATDTSAVADSSDTVGFATDSSDTVSFVSDTAGTASVADSTAADSSRAGAAPAPAYAPPVDSAKLMRDTLGIPMRDSIGRFIDTLGHSIDSLGRSLDSLGMLGPDTIAAHTLWLDAEDIRLLGENRVNVVHNINSNLKIASGYRFLYNELKDAGANVTLGTDGCASSNNLDMLEAMKTAALVQKAWREDPKAMPLKEVMDMATVNGARALGLNAGTIECGREADLLLVNMRCPAFVPDINFLSNLVYSAHSDVVDTVICGGDILMRGRVVEGEQEVLDAASEAGRKLLSKSGMKLI